MTCGYGKLPLQMQYNCLYSFTGLMVNHNLKRVLENLASAVTVDGKWYIIQCVLAAGDENSLPFREKGNP